MDGNDKKLVTKCPKCGAFNLVVIKPGYAGLIQCGKCKNIFSRLEGMRAGGKVLKCQD